MILILLNLLKYDEDILVQEFYNLMTSGLYLIIDITDHLFQFVSIDTSKKNIISQML